MGTTTGRAGIVGGGIAGLAAAIALRRRGWDVTVYERAPRFTEVGAGIVLSANALHALDLLGVGARVRSHLIIDRPGTVRNQHGRILLTARIDDFVGGLVALHRADLISILAAAVPAECVRHGTEVTGVRPDGRIETHSDTERYDIVIAADGVHSRARTAVWPHPPPVRRTGISSWRWILDRPAPDEVGVVWGRYAECGIVPMSGDRTMFFAGARRPITSLDHFADWPDPVPSVIADATPDRIVTGDLLEIAVPRHLWRGRVALIGDAGHAMRPTLGQGAGLALEDAVVVADCAPDLRQYSVIRRRRVAAMNIVSRHGMRLTAPGSTLLAAVRDVAVRTTPDAAAVRLLRTTNSRLLGAWKRPRSATDRG
ncbi:putative FAD-binding monooxygenase [Nocardia nova SH22a]|uniref:Putative FAD-binding monooxygenase n=1 Tax=Nocardia nova SH22a TaxID=1415166 RepID=W5TIW6_9NOCA|nr:FAD-dependent oxidoreductase [Nocardia nova]AHH19109.1 putative FAD-binding monooxygenase [Nocardia nova SH22a]